MSLTKRCAAEAFGTFSLVFAGTGAIAIDDVVATADAERIDEEHSDDAKMLWALFLGENWAEQRDWLPLHGERHRLRALFETLVPTAVGFECYAYYLAKAGTPTLPDALVGVTTKISEAGRSDLLNNVAVFYLDEILTRLIFGGDRRIRAERLLRGAVLRILVQCNIENGHTCAILAGWLPNA